VFLPSDQMDEQQLSAQFPGVQLIEPSLSFDDEATPPRMGSCMAAVGWNHDHHENLEEFDS
jgi:hypothetical protein